MHAYTNHGDIFEEAPSVGLSEVRVDRHLLTTHAHKGAAGKNSGVCALPLHRVTSAAKKVRL